MGRPRRAPFVFLVEFAQLIQTLKLPVISHRPLPAVVALIVAALSVGCDLGDPSLSVYAPQTAGIVASATPADDGLLAYTLANGKTVNVDVHSWISGFGASAGDLLLAGSSPQTWAYAVANQPGGSTDCFHIAGPTRDRGQSVDIQVTVESHDIYLRFPKASTFSPNEFLGVCLDGAGLAHPIPSQPS